MCNVFRRTKRLQTCQTSQRQLQCFIFLGKAKAHHALVKPVAIKRRQRNRRHADFGRQPLAEIGFAQVADLRNIDALEITAFAGQQLEARGRQSGA